MGLMGNDADIPLTLCQVHVLSMEDETEENVMSHSLCKKSDKNSDIDKLEASIVPEASIISMGGQCFLKHKSDEKVRRNYTDSLLFCRRMGYDLLTNSHTATYKKMINLLKDEK